MHTLSIRQPYASAIVAGVKTVENRAWSPPTKCVGEDLLIHASTHRQFIDDPVVMRSIRAAWPECPVDFPLGGIVGVVRVVGSKNLAGTPQDIWACGPICWVLDAPQAVEFIKVRGRLGVFQVEVPPEVCRLLQRRQPHRLVGGSGFALPVKF